MERPEPRPVRWAAGVEYCGTNFSGWQIQTHAASIQEQLEAALSRVADQPISTVAAGRTDAGVHARGQVVHFDSTALRTPNAWMLGANTVLGKEISLRWVKQVPDRFHARFSATGRQYRYLIHNDRARSALLHGRAAWESKHLDEQAMHRAAQALVGRHDFSGFRGAACEASNPVRHMRKVSVTREGSVISIEVSANAFLLHMVRNISGSLMEVGCGRRDEAWIAEILASGQRSSAGRTAPPSGLYFTAVEYPAEFAIPQAQAFALA